VTHRVAPSFSEAQTSRQEERVEKGENRQTPYHQTLRRPSDLDDVEVEEAMRANDFEPAAAARHLGIRRPSLYNLIRRHPRLRLASFGSGSSPPAEYCPLE